MRLALLGLLFAQAVGFASTILPYQLTGVLPEGIPGTTLTAANTAFTVDFLIPSGPLTAGGGAHEATVLLSGTYSLGGVTVLASGISTTFYDTSVGGGLSFTLSNGGNSLFISYGGPQLFSGTVFSPTMLAGTFVLPANPQSPSNVSFVTVNDGPTFAFTVDGVFTSNVATVPEPSSGAFTTCGLAAIGWWFRQRRL